MIMQSRQLGAFRISRVLEYSGPTQTPEFLFPSEDHAALAANAAWLAPDYYVPHMQRLVVTVQLWVLHAGPEVIVIDTGVGNLKPRPAERMNMLNSLVLPWLEAAGAGPEQVTHIVLTHLHVDHVGWNTVLTDGKWVPTFPRARYFFPKDDFLYWQEQYDGGQRDVNGGSFADSVLPIFEAGLAEFSEAGKEVAGVLMAEPAPGHSPGQLTYRLRSEGEEALFAADVMHHPVQVVCPEWNSRYCIWPEAARASRARLLIQAAAREALIMPMHFGAPYCGYIRRQGVGFAFEPARW